jgi:hypothetical protein
MQTRDARKVSGKTPAPSSSLKKRAELLKTLGVLVLVLGAASASIVYWSGQKRSASQSNNQGTSADSGWKDSTLSSEDLKGSSRTIEMNYGKVAVLMVSWLHWWEQFKSHESLAMVIATISTLTAITCFILAKGRFR